MNELLLDLKEAEKELKGIMGLNVRKLKHNAIVKDLIERVDKK